MSDPTRLPPAVRRLVEADRNHRPSPTRLTADQLRLLEQVARHPERFAEPVSPVSAVQALAHGNRAKAVPLLARIVADAGLAAPVRVTAARALGRLAGADAERVLLRHRSAPDPRVQQAVLRSLGAVGGAAALRSLRRLEDPVDRAARRQLVLARALIACREGVVPEPLGDDELDRRPEQVGDLTTLEGSLLTTAATSAVRARLAGSQYGIELAPRALAIRCGRADWTVFLNAEIEAARLGERLTDRPWILGLVAGWHGEGGRALVKHVVLATPVSERATRVDVVRRDGTPAYRADLTSQGTGVRFTLTDLGRPGTAPTYLRGRLSARSFELDETAVSSRLTKVRSSVAVPARRRTGPHHFGPDQEDSHGTG